MKPSPKSNLDRIAEDIEHKVRGIVDDHPWTRDLPEVERRNMAYVAGHSATSALTREAAEAVDRR